MWTRKNIALTFWIPFFIGGTIFSYLALAYMNGLDQSLKQPIDLAYAIFVSYLDMGLVFGVASVTCLNILSKLIDWKRGNSSTESESVGG